MGSIHCALVHHPVRDRDGNLVTSAITNVDVHDLARSARTYGLAGYWVVSPIEAQRTLVDRILDHWREGAGARRVPERTVALSICTPIESVQAAVSAIERMEGARPAIWMTAARAPEGKTILGWQEARIALEATTRPVLILFGTAHGLHAKIVAEADVVLAPIQPHGDYNHLSVRAAAAITLDRLFGDRGSP